MIRVEPKPEPEDFDAKVRDKGNRWLETQGIPPDRHCPSAFWKDRDYWRHALDDLHDAYGGVCAYSSLPTGRGGASVDHHRSKDAHPSLAYEWSNFRLIAHRLNSAKGSIKDPIDPFQLPEEAYRLDPITGEIYANPNLDDADVRSARERFVEKLGLRKRGWGLDRKKWIDGYLRGEISEDWLAQSAPFIHAELKRQNLLRSEKQFK